MGVSIYFDTRKVNNLIELVVDLAAVHAQICPEWRSRIEGIAPLRLALRSPGVLPGSLPALVL